VTEEVVIYICFLDVWKCNGFERERERERERRVVGIDLEAVVPNQSSTRCNNSVD
jgi:hypothetical protein